ncbi:hypothetical protein Vadar_010031 [Vaccinium darrowii]|uniref:Uncharacterized protein n=1 Tax=Vaccinium darrowii TaxID=229202 RepID=A0ACB7ZI43_9ERIC|nr:hypothetical protein Vadar_010031 [Vaccinium darrowii]
MGRSPCCAKEGLNRGAWTAIEDKILTEYIKLHGEGKWRNLPKRAGLKRCGKSCRLRWLNYLRPDIKRGNITHDEEDLIIRLHKLLGNRWSLIAGRLPGRTDNEIKNYWNTSICKKVQGSKSLNQSKSKSSFKTDEPKPNTESNVVRTKASRCTKLLTSPEAQNLQDLLRDRVVSPEPANSVSPFPSMEDNSFDFAINFDQMDEKFLSDFFHADFAPLSDFDQNGLETGDTSTNTSCSSQNSDQALLFSSEFMYCGFDPHSMAPLPDMGIDWIQDQ